IASMRTFLTIQNYRCFVSPIEVEIARGFTAFVGVNNAGKSAIMRFLLELRPFLKSLTTGNILNGYLNQQMGTATLNQVLDHHEIFANRNSEPIRFSFRFEYDESEKDPTLLPGIDEYRFILHRNLTATGSVFIGGQPLNSFGQITAFNADN